jgi:hypothetical protein
LGSSKRHLAPTRRPSTGGRIYVWEYPETVESFAGWHLTADSVGGDRLLAAIDDLLSGAFVESASFTVDPVTPAVLAVPNNRRAKASSPKYLRMKMAEDPRHLFFHKTAESLTIEAGRERLEELRDSITQVARGEGDFAMVPDQRRRPPDQALWFWWLLSSG